MIKQLRVVPFRRCSLSRKRRKNRRVEPGKSPDPTTARTSSLPDFLDRAIPVADYQKGEEVRAWVIRQVCLCAKLSPDKVTDDTGLTGQLLYELIMTAALQYQMPMVMQFDESMTVGQFVSLLEQRIASNKRSQEAFRASRV